MQSHSTPIQSRDIATDRLFLLAIFAVQGIVAAMMFTRVPDIQLAAGLSEGQLGMVLMGAPVGGMTTFAIATKLIERFGTRAIILGSYPLMALAAPLLTVSINPAAMFAVLFVFGAMNSAGNIAINVEADRFEAASGSRIMNRCHGLWSVVFFFASLGGGLIRGAGVATELHLWAMVPLFCIASLAIAVPMRSFPPRVTAGKPNRFVLPTLAVLALVAFGLGAELLEGASRVWATIYIRDVFDVPAVVESAALPALILSMAVARLVADGIIDRFGPQRVASTALGIAIVGLCVVVFANNAYLAIVGFGIAGLGASVIYPLMISAAARLGDRPASENVAALTMVVQLLLLVSPAIIGAVAEGLGVRVAFGLLLPLLAIGLIMSRMLK